MSWRWFSPHLRRPIIVQPIHRLWLMTALMLLSASSFIPRMFSPRGDAPDYLNVLEFLNGTFSGEFTLFNRLIASPLFLISSFAIGKLLPQIGFGLVVMNILGYFVLVSGMFYLAKRIFQSEIVALIAALLLMSNQVLLNFGLGFMADTWGIALFVWGSYWAMSYYRQPEQKKYFWYSLLTAIVGFFFREYGALGLLTLGMVILLRVRPVSAMFKQGLLALAVFLPLPLLYYWWFYQTFGFTYLDWFSHNVTVYAAGSGAADYSLLLIIKILVWLFLAGWPLVVLGFVKLRDSSREIIFSLICLLPASVFFLLWPSQNERVSLILVPLLSLIAAYGASHIRNRLILFVYLFFYILVNFHTHWLKTVINF